MPTVPTAKNGGFCSLPRLAKQGDVNTTLKAREIHAKDRALGQEPKKPPV